MKSSVSIYNSYLLSLVTLFADHGVAAFQVVPHQRDAARNMRQSTAMDPTATIAQYSALHMFGGLFGGDSKSKLALDEPVIVYSTLDDDKHVEFEGLSDYITKWANTMFTNGGIKLTTPVAVEPVSNENSRGIRLIFKNTNTGYKSKNEESDSGNALPQDASNDAPKKKKKGTMQGGVEILVERTDSSQVQVLARRCEIDDDTVIKEMSEEAIMSELRQAIAVWKREK